MKSAMTDHSAFDGNKSLTNINCWLAAKGLAHNPFERWSADHDQDLPYYFVDVVGAFDELRRHTTPSIIFARHGCGKTAQRQMLAAHYRPANLQSRWLSVPYTYAGFERVLASADYDLSRVQSSHHVAALLRLGLIALDREAHHDDVVGKALASPDIAAKWAAYTSRFAPHLFAGSSPNDGVDPLADMSSSEMLEGYVELIHAAGLDGCAIWWTDWTSFLSQLATRFRQSHSWLRCWAHLH